MEHLIFLRSSTLEVATMNMFIKGETAFIPDLLLIFFYISVFLLDHVVDRIFIVYIILYDEEKLLTLFFLVSAMTPLIPLLMQLSFQKISPISNFCLYTLSIILTILGLDSIYLGAEALKGIIEFKEALNISKPHCFIHISEVKLFAFKTYCYISILIKTIPQLMWLPILIVESNLTEFEHLLSLISIIANILILALTITVTFPVRKSKTVYKTCIPLLMKCFSKFMATICACCVHLIVFTLVYRYMKLKVFIVLLPKFIIWLYPSYHNLRRKVHYLSNLEVFVHGLCFALISCFIYIHPFYGKGTFFYYSFNLFSFLVEMISINAFSENNGELTVVYLTLRVLVHGYMACFRVIDNLFTVKDEPVEGKNTTVQDLVKTTSQGDLLGTKDESKNPTVQDLKKTTSQGEVLERKDEEFTSSPLATVNETENGDDNLEVRQLSTVIHQNERDN